MAVVLAVDVGCVLAFDQRVLVDGVRVNTDRKAYGVGQTIKVSMFLVNKLDQVFDTCIGYREVSFEGFPFPGDGQGASVDYPRDPHCGSIQPRSERLEAVLDWRLLLPGTYTVTVSMRTISPSLPLFKGNSTILIVPLA